MDQIGFHAWTIQITLPAYVMSLCFTGLHAGEISINGANLLASGWLGIFDKVNVAWFANPAYLIAFIWFVFKRYDQACWWSSAAALMALDTFRAEKWYGPIYDIPIDSIGVAFYLWEFSIVWLAIGSFVGWRNTRRMARGKSDQAHQPIAQMSLSTINLRSSLGRTQRPDSP